MSSLNVDRICAMGEYAGPQFVAWTGLPKLMRRYAPQRPSRMKMKKITPPPPPPKKKSGRGAPGAPHVPPPLKPPPPATAEVSAATGPRKGEQRAHQHERQRHQRAEGESPAPAHDCAGAPPPVSDWPQLVQNLAFAAFCVPHLGQAIVAPVGAGAGESA